MALIKFGGGITEMRGSIAGNTYARNRFGAYSRARTKPVNPMSPRQTAARIAIMFLAEQWREAPMTDAKRTAWETYANAVNWQNMLGETVHLTGYNHFIRGNCSRLQCGETFVDDGPAELGLPAGDPLFQVTDLSAALQSGKVTFDDGFDWCSEDDAHLIVDMGLPQNASRNFFGGPWRYWFDGDGAVGVPAVSPFGPIANLPWPAIEGQKVWFRATILRADARTTTKFLCTPVIVAA